MATCKHCGRKYSNPKAHAVACHVQQRAAYVKHLDRGDGHIISFHGWHAIARATRLYGSSALMSVAGTSWGDVAALFGLRYKPISGPGRSWHADRTQNAALRAALNAPLTDAERHACALRGRMEDTGGLHSSWR